MRWIDERKKALMFQYLFLFSAVLILAAIVISGEALWEDALKTDFTRRNRLPCPAYPFGTDGEGCISSNDLWSFAEYPNRFFNGSNECGDCFYNGDAGINGKMGRWHCSHGN